MGRFFLFKRNKDIYSNYSAAVTNLKNLDVSKIEDGEQLFARFKKPNGDISTVAGLVFKSGSTSSITIANSELEYDSATNKLTFSNVNGSKEYFLSGLRIIDNMVYSAETQTLVIYYKVPGTEEDQTLEIPLDTLIEETIGGDGINVETVAASGEDTHRVVSIDLDENTSSLLTVSANGLKLNKNVVSSATLNDIDFENNGDGTLSLVIDGYDLYIGEAYDEVEHPISALTSISSAETLSEAVNINENNSALLEQIVLDNELVAAKSFAAIQKSVDLNENLEYVPSSDMSFASGASTVANAIELLDAALKNVKDTVVGLDVKGDDETIDVTKNTDGTYTIALKEIIDCGEF